MPNHTYIKVYWDDLLDNYTRARELEIQRYFEKKYGAKANVVFRAIRNTSSADMQGIRADATDQVMDVQFQRKLMKKYLQDNQIDINWEFLLKLDDNVNSRIESAKEMNMRYKKFSIRRIFLNNFLSYADTDQCLDITNMHGLTVVRSQPENKAGKTTSVVDALLFAFFGRTTKTEVQAEIFNTYTKSDEVVVKVEIEIDGEVYLIERRLERRLKRDKSSYNVTGSLEFKRPLPDGGWKDLKGDERSETEKTINDYIGKYEDFLLTVITTLKHFYSLIESKPTERGKIFTRFVGVEVLAEKADMCKKMQDDWYKTSKLAYTSSATIDQQIADETTKEEGYEKLAAAARVEMSEADGKIALMEKDIEITTLKKHQNVDQELYKVREEDIVDGIAKLETTIAAKQASIEKLKTDLVVPTVDFDVDVYNTIKGNLQEKNNQLTEAKTKKSMTERGINDLKNGEFCPTCKQPLKGVDHKAEIAEKEKEVETFTAQIAEITEAIAALNTEIAEHEANKTAWDTHSKAVLVIQRNEVELGVYRNNLTLGKEKLEKYRSNKTFIEDNRLIDTQLQKLNGQLREMRENREGKLLSLHGYEKDIKTATATIAKLQESKKDVVRDEVINKIYNVYRELFGKNGISKMILGTMIPIINSYLNQMMFDTVSFRLEIRLNDKNEVEFWMVDNEGEVEKRLLSGSGYESTISLLALRCVLSKVCSLPKPNVVVFDEVFGQVANENMPLLGAFFERMKEYFDAIFIITHNPVMLDWADHVINVKKTDNLTYIVANDIQKK